MCSGDLAERDDGKNLGKDGSKGRNTGVIA